MVRDLLVLLRPWQWSKNGIIFAGLVFSLNLVHPEYLLRSVGAFLVFCLASSAIYILNDVLDMERDRIHPVKRFRPIASGTVPRGRAFVLFLIAVAGALAAGAGLGSLFAATLVAFLLVNGAYSLYLKNVVILDVMLVAASFVLRAIAGVMALRPLDPELEISPWLLVCTMFLALFLALGKRRHELALLDEEAAGHRAVLGDYSRSFLDQLISIVTAGTLIAYAIYTIAPGTVSKFHSPGLVYTLPFVAYGIFRYLYLILLQEGGASPSRTLYRDLPILVTILAWLGVVVLVIYTEG